MPTKTTSRRRVPRFDLCAGHLCLDFINTLDDRPSSQPKELLEDYSDLVRFGEDSGIVEPAQVDRLLELSHVTPAPAEWALRAALELREALYTLFSAIIDKRTLPATSLATLNRYVQESAVHSRLVDTKGGFEWRIDQADSSFDAVLWPIARSAADLLSSPLLPFVRTCSSKTCQWLFVDTSKNHRRRWCKMKLCGNRAKVRRFYKKQSG